MSRARGCDGVDGLLQWSDAVPPVHVWGQVAEPSAVPALIAQLRPCAFGAGQVIFAQGDPGERVFVISCGKVKISLRGPGGLENLVAVLGPSDLFGELAVFDPGQRTGTATAITDVTALWLDRVTVCTWMAEQPLVAERLLELLTRRLRRTDDDLVGLISSDLASRLARQLLLLAQRFGTREGDALRVPHELTQTEMAQLVGADRASVNKTLQDFVSRGWILTAHKSALIIDRDALAHQAKTTTTSSAHASRPRRRPLRASA